MKECFNTYNFQEDTLKLIEIVNSILEEYERQGYDLTLRQLYYQLVSRDIISNSQRSYTRLGSIVNKGRMAGLIDWDMIVDRGRSTVQNQHWENPGEIIKVAARSFKIDKWRDQPVHIEVMVEKQALEGVLIPVCRELDISFTANKGYSSQIFMYRKGKFLSGKVDDGKHVHILYLGDHDPSGLDMDRDVLDRMEIFSGCFGSMISLHRLALTWDQIEEFQPPPNPDKITDSRAGPYIRKYGDESWELDAVEPRTLAKLVKDFVSDYRDPILWEDSIKKEEEQREELIKIAERYE